MYISEIGRLLPSQTVQHLVYWLGINQIDCDMGTIESKSSWDQTRFKVKHFNYHLYLSNGVFIRSHKPRVQGGNTVIEECSIAKIRTFLFLSIDYIGFVLLLEFWYQRKKRLYFILRLKRSIFQFDSLTGLVSRAAIFEAERTKVKGTLFWRILFFGIEVFFDWHYWFQEKRRSDHRTVYVDVFGYLFGTILNELSIKFNFIK